MMSSHVSRHALNAFTRPRDVNPTWWQLASFIRVIIYSLVFLHASPCCGADDSTTELQDVPLVTGDSNWSLSTVSFISPTVKAAMSDDSLLPDIRPTSSSSWIPETTPLVLPSEGPFESEIIRPSSAIMTAPFLMSSKFDDLTMTSETAPLHSIFPPTAPTRDATSAESGSSHQTLSDAGLVPSSSIVPFPGNDETVAGGVITTSSSRVGPVSADSSQIFISSPVSSDLNVIRPSTSAEVVVSSDSPAPSAVFPPTLATSSMVNVTEPEAVASTSSPAVRLVKRRFVFVVNGTCSPVEQETDRMLASKIQSTVNQALQNSMSLDADGREESSRDNETQSPPVVNSDVQVHPRSCRTYLDVFVTVRADNAEAILDSLAQKMEGLRQSKYNTTATHVQSRQYQLLYILGDDMERPNDTTEVSPEVTARPAQPGGLLTVEELRIFIAVGTFFGFLICLTLIICCVKCCRRQPKESTDPLDIADLPHINMHLEDYSLTKIPRPNTLYSDYLRTDPVPRHYATRPSTHVPAQPLDTSVVPLDEAVPRYEALRYPASHPTHGANLSTFGRSHRNKATPSALDPATGAPLPPPPIHTVIDDDNMADFLASGHSREKLTAPYFTPRAHNSSGPLSFAGADNHSYVMT